MRRLITPRATVVVGIIIGFTIHAGILLLGAKYIGDSVWTVFIAVSTFLAAMGAISAVVWAVFHQVILSKLHRPKLEIRRFGEKPPYLRRVPEVDPKTGKKHSVAFYVTIVLENTGKKMAKNAQPLLTNKGERIHGKWERESDWLPVPLLWIFDEPTIFADKKPTEEKDLVPHRPYLFNLGAVSTSEPDNFSLLPIVIARNQRQHYTPGEYCFEITAFAEGVYPPAKKYFFVAWDGGCTEKFEEVRARIKIDQSAHAPWEK